MDTEIARRIQLCKRLRNPNWDSLIAGVKNLGEAEEAFVRLHPPGLVGALWAHFEATRDHCGCESPDHERSDCSVRLIERILLDEESR